VVDGDTLTDADSLEADVKRSMIAHAREAVLLIDGSKLTERGLIAIAPLSSVAIALATDIDSQQAVTLGRAGTNVRIVRSAESA